MKLIYSHLQKFLPDLKVEPKKLRDDLTMIGHFVNFFKKIDNEIVFDLDIKINRGDCLGYYGIAKDLSVYYKIPLQNLSQEITSRSNYSLPIKVSTKNVKKIMAVKISDLKNTSSPQWLQTFLKLHNVNPINTIVDLTNYIMFLYGIPSHAFDVNKSTDNLVWEMNPKFKEFISLNGSKLILDKNILMINNKDKALSLSFWGGESCAINKNTTETIIEIAIYDRTTVRKNSRQLKSVTEASIRLEKDLDPELIPKAFNHLTTLILKNCNGQINSKVYDYYPQKIKSPQIKFNPQKASLISGIEIPTDFSLDCLTRLGCKINDSIITPPSIRKDITIEADLLEEIIRFWGYQKIPINQPLPFKKITDITPKEIYLIESLKDQLVNLGYDEILSWPLVTTPLHKENVITTQNSINSEAIYLRQSLIQSLKKQLDQYQRFKLPNPQFFEIGNVFFKEEDKFIEKTSLGLFNDNSQKLKNDLQKLKLKTTIIDNNFAEIIIDNLPKPNKHTPLITNNEAIELNSQIITLDANITLDKKEDPLKLIKKYSQIIGSKFLWKLIITDIYKDSKTNKYKYTFQASYFNLDDKKAKEIHLQAFDLK
jgi:phenylalanyl-tRNA synthetase beta chain